MPAGPRSAKQVRRAVVAHVDGALREAVGQLAEPLHAMAEYHFGWVDDNGGSVDPLAVAPRRRAATLALLSAGSEGTAWQQARNVAVANTLTAGGMFVHDDLVDGDRVRYGRPTIWQKYGMPVAVHLGTALVTLALRQLDHEPSEIAWRLREGMTTCVTTICQGQAAEAAIEGGHTATWTQVLKIYEAKTAAGYFLSSGALVAGATDERARACYDLGQSFGVALQLVNDFESLWKDSASGLKDPMSDLRQRKMTAVVAFALEHRGPQVAELADFYSGDNSGEADVDQLRRLRGLLEVCGAKAWLEEQIATRTKVMYQNLRRAAADAVSAAELTGVLSDLVAPPKRSSWGL
ncbi:polyprenyl synthetase family protein [Streptomyces syringium]|uniref:polyprenyl synthetase family protein n=1 Tax=Streptomyces syringium TaxID=76729 RepID=UPI00345179D3